MSIVLGVKKVLDRGEQKYLLRYIKALKLGDLPVVYTRSGLHCHLNDHDGLIINDNGRTIGLLRIGATYDADQLHTFVKQLKSCGTRLAKLNKALRDKNRNWSGNKEFII